MKSGVLRIRENLGNSVVGPPGIALVLDAQVIEFSGNRIDRRSIGNKHPVDIPHDLHFVIGARDQNDSVTS
jgi:hypothetical protein